MNGWKSGVLKHPFIHSIIHPFIMKTSIIGGGIIGLFSAYYLNQAGFEVEVIEAGDLSEGCSFGNAGMIVPSHFIPLAAPGVVAKGVRWLFSAKSPLYIRPRLNWELAQWLWRFYRSCTAAKVNEAIPVLKDFQEWSRTLYQELSALEDFDFFYEQKGILMLYRSEKAEKEEAEVAEQAHEIGMEAHLLSADALKQLEPHTPLDVLGGVHYPGDAHLYPNHLMQQLVTYLKERGVSFRTHTRITGFQRDKGRITALMTESGERISTSQVIAAAGSWTGRLLKSLGIQLLLQGGKGYSITLQGNEQNIMTPSILTEAKVAMTPMGSDLRIGGTLEINHFDARIREPRLQGILDAVPKYYPELRVAKPDLSAVWHGFRPCTPDGLPYIGWSDKYDNLMIATGHAMMGLSMGPATGKLVAELVQGKVSFQDQGLFHPGRF